MKEELKSLLWQKGKRPDVWAIVDTARDQRAYFSLTNTFLNASCLFAGPLPEALEMASPYLVQLDSEDKFTDFLVDQWGKSLCIFVRCDSSLTELRRHLRGFLRVKNSSGAMMLFRYYDPRVMRVYLPTCGSGELETVFGPIQSYFTESEDSKNLIEFQFEKRKLKITERPLQAGPAAPAGPLAGIAIGQPMLVVQRGNGPTKRVPVELAGAGKGGKLIRSGPEIQVYRSATAGKELAFVDNVHELPASDLNPDLTVYVEGVGAGAATLKLDLGLGGKAEQAMPVAELKLETGAGAEQYAGGIVVSAANGGSILPRRRIEVTCSSPAPLTQKLTLRSGPKGPALRLYQSADSGQGHSLKTPFEFDPPTAPVAFWLEGDVPSAAPGDAVLQLALAGSDIVSDWCAVTVAAVSSISAEIPGTPQRTARVPVAPVSSQFTAKAPLVLLSGSVDSGAPVLLKAKILPAGTPVVWSVSRREEDGPDAIKASERPLPSCEQGRLLADAAGSFQITAIAGAVPEWGGAGYALDLILVHAEVVENRTAVNARFAGCTRDTGANRFVLRSGRESGDAPLRLSALVRLTGGGPDGKGGLDTIHGGWINNVVSNNTGARYKGAAPLAAGYCMEDGAAIQLDTGPLLDTTRAGGGGAETCMASSEPAGPLIRTAEEGKEACHVEVRASEAPLTSWPAKDAANRPLEQIWSYLECRSYLALWAADAPRSMGVLLEAAWSFTGDYMCSATRTPTAVVPARLAAGRSTAYPALTSGAAAGVEMYAPTTAATGRRLPEE